MEPWRPHHLHWNQVPAAAVPCLGERGYVCMLCSEPAALCAAAGATGISLCCQNAGITGTTQDLLWRPSRPLGNKSLVFLLAWLQRGRQRTLSASSRARRELLSGTSLPTGQCLLGPPLHSLKRPPNAWFGLAYLAGRFSHLRLGLQPLFALRHGERQAVQHASRLVRWGTMPAGLGKAAQVDLQRMKGALRKWKASACLV